MKSHPKNKILRIALMTVITFVVFSILSSGLFFAVFFKRPGRGKTSKTDVKNTYAQTATPISMKTQSGSLNGYLFGKKSDLGTIVIVPGIEGNSSGYMPEAAFFVSQGWQVVAYDSTGSENNEEDTKYGFAQSKLDIHSAVDYVVASEDISSQNIFLYGHSMGGYGVAAVSNDGLPINAIVSVAGFNSPNDVIIDSAEKYIGKIARIEYPFFYVNNFMRFGMEGNETAADAINDSDIPIYVIAFKDDPVIPYESSIFKQQGEIGNVNARFILLEGKFAGHHTTEVLSADPEMMNKINQFYLRNIH